MAQFIQIGFKVADFGKWKGDFDGHQKARAEAGLELEHVFRAEGDANDVTILFRILDPAKAKAFMESDDLKEKMRDSGVISKPDIRMLHD